MRYRCRSTMQAGGARLDAHQAVRWPPGRLRVSVAPAWHIGKLGERIDGHDGSIAAHLQEYGRGIVVTRAGPRNHAHEDAYVTARDAFAAVVRQFEDHARALRGQVKPHEPPLTHGRAVRCVAGEDCGLITVGNGQTICFHRNRLAAGGCGLATRFARR